MSSLMLRIAIACLIGHAAAAVSAEIPTHPPFNMDPVFVSGEDGYHTYRIPALAVAANGVILAFCEGRKQSRSDSGDIDLLLRRSEDHGQTWGPVMCVADHGSDTIGNPCPIVDRRNGAVLLLMTGNKGSTDQSAINQGTAPARTVWISESHDHGLTWSKPRDISLVASAREWRWYATGPGHGIQLRDGRLIAPCDHANGPAEDDMRSHVIYSDDGGASWSIGGIVEKRTDESTLVELSDGSLCLNMRNYRGTNRRAVSFSRDRGQTWTAAVDDPALIEPVCQASLLRLSEEKTQGKNRILFSNPASQKREKLTVRVSYDECRSWFASRVIWPGPSAYSDLALAGDQTIGCLLECGMQSPYEQIAYARFTLGWLSDGKDSF